MALLNNTSKNTDPYSAFNFLSTFFSFPTDPPVCKSEAQIIRAAVKQTVNITCDIDANPMVIYLLALNVRKLLDH